MADGKARRAPRLNGQFAAKPRQSYAIKSESGWYLIIFFIFSGKRADNMSNAAFFFSASVSGCRFRMPGGIGIPPLYAGTMAALPGQRVSQEPDGLFFRRLRQGKGPGLLAGVPYLGHVRRSPVAGVPYLGHVRPLPVAGVPYLGHVRPLPVAGVPYLGHVRPLPVAGDRCPVPFRPSLSLCRHDVRSGGFPPIKS